jgi:hypothetical protein
MGDELISNEMNAGVVKSKWLKYQNEQNRIR